MKISGQHITNIESDDLLAAQIANASTPQEKETATRRKYGFEATKTMIRTEMGAFTIGRPKATADRTVEQLEIAGLVGLYWL